jgi:hypothetical protein
MSTLTWQMPNYLSFIYRLAPIREGLAWRLKISHSDPLGQRKIGYNALKAGASELCHCPADGLASQI